MAYDFLKFKNNLKEVEGWLAKEFSTIRTGAASPALLDSIKVESYGSLMPINQLASVNIEDARSLRINPWDLSQVKPIEKAITIANLGVSVTVDGKGLRVIFPELTSERRVLLIKAAKEKLEKARISLRGERDDVWSDIQKKEKDGEISEDEKFRLKDQMQKEIDDSNTKLESLFVKKEKEISI